MRDDVLRVHECADREKEQGGKQVPQRLNGLFHAPNVGDWPATTPARNEPRASDTPKKSDATHARPIATTGTVKLKISADAAALASSHGAVWPARDR